MKDMDFKRLSADAADAVTIGLLAEIERDRERVLRENRMSDDDTAFTLRFRERAITVRRSNAFSALETYAELFYKNNHFLHSEFVPRRSDVIVDFGANEGFYDLRCKELAPDCRIYAFEPNPWEYELLERNLEINRVAGVTIDRRAIYGYETELDFEVIPQIGPIGGIQLRTPARKWLREEFIRKIKVPAIPPDRVFADYRLDHVDILKIDVEGAELALLANFVGLDRVDRVVVEYHSPEGEKTLREIFAGRGFRHVFTDAEPGDYYGDLYFIRSNL